MSRVVNHRPRPGPFYWDYRCLRCDQAVDAHPTLWQRLMGHFQSK